MFGQVALGLIFSKADGKTTRVEKAWKNDKAQIAETTGVCSGDYLLYAGSTGYDPCFVTAINAKTGEVAWQEPGFSLANLVSADGKDTVARCAGSSRSGHCRSRSVEGKFQGEYARTLEPQAFTAPALADKNLYLRGSEEYHAHRPGQTELTCIKTHRWGEQGPPSNVGSVQGQPDAIDPDARRFASRLLFVALHARWLGTLHRSWHGKPLAARSFCVPFHRAPQVVRNGTATHPAGRPCPGRAPRSLRSPPGGGGATRAGSAGSLGGIETIGACIVSRAMERATRTLDPCHWACNATALDLGNCAVRGTCHQRVRTQRRNPRRS